MDKLKRDGEACGKMNVKEPVHCYQRIYGPVEYTDEQKAEWEVAMTEKFDARQEIFDGKAVLKKLNGMV